MGSEIMVSVQDGSSYYAGQYSTLCYLSHMFLVSSSGTCGFHISPHEVQLQIGDTSYGGIEEVTSNDLLWLLKYYIIIFAIVKSHQISQLVTCFSGHFQTFQDTGMTLDTLVSDWQWSKAYPTVSADSRRL